MQSWAQAGSLTLPGSHGTNSPRPHSPGSPSSIGLCQDPLGGSRSSILHPASLSLAVLCLSTHPELQRTAHCHLPQNDRTSGLAPTSSPFSASTFSLYTFINLIPPAPCPSSTSWPTSSFPQITPPPPPPPHHKSFPAGLVISQDKPAKEEQEPAPHAGESPLAGHITSARHHPASELRSALGRGTGHPYQGMGAPKHPQSCNISQLLSA